MKTQKPFSFIGNGTRAYKILYSMAISLLDNYKLKVAAVLVRVPVCFSLKHEERRRNIKEMRV